MKITNYSSDDILGWNEEDFEDVICELVNCNVLSGMPIHPVNNQFYLQHSDDWHKRKLGLTPEYFVQKRIEELEKELKRLKQNEKV